LAGVKAGIGPGNPGHKGPAGPGSERSVFAVEPDLVRGERQGQRVWTFEQAVIHINDKTLVAVFKSILDSVYVTISSLREINARSGRCKKHEQKIVHFQLQKTYPKIPSTQPGYNPRAETDLRPLRILD
jgi:hypothetical protein